MLTCRFNVIYYEEIIKKPFEMFFPKCVSTKTIRLFALDFYEAIVDSGFALVNYHLRQIESK